MEACELVKELKKTVMKEQSYIDVVEWCKKNYDNMDIKDKNQHILFELATRYLMNNKIGKWTKEDALVIVNYLPRKLARNLGIYEDVTVKVLEESNYDQVSKNSDAVCIHNDDGSCNLVYSNRIINQLLSNDYGSFLRGMQSMFHEVFHALQYGAMTKQELHGVKVPKSEKIYLMALETIARKLNEKFYKDNYGKLIKENHAEKQGLIKAMDEIKNYNPRLYDCYNQDVIKQRISEYEKNFYEAKSILGSGKEIDFMVEIDTRASLYIQEHPEVLKEYSVLQIGFNLDGTKKDIRKLLEDRDESLRNGEDREKIDKLYNIIANHRNVQMCGLKGSKDELYGLIDYIEQTGTNDEFIFNLIRFRLEKKTNMTKEKIEPYIENLHSLANKRRKQISEGKSGFEDCIKDENTKLSEMQNTTKTTKINIFGDLNIENSNEDKSLE